MEDNTDTHLAYQSEGRLVGERPERGRFAGGGWAQGMDGDRTTWNPAPTNVHHWGNASGVLADSGGRKSGKGMFGGLTGNVTSALLV